MAKGWTLGEIKAARYILWASCALDYACTHYSTLDMDELIAHFGADFDIVGRRQELLDHLVCKACGRKGAQTRIALQDAPTAGASHSRSRTSGRG